MRRVRVLASVVFGLTLAFGASAQLVAVPGTHVALAPPQGFTLAREFGGFENKRGGSSITASFAATDSVELDLGGSGSLDANVPRVAKLEGAVAGSGRLAPRGAAADCKFTIAGSGSADASAFACDSSARVNVSGSGSAKLSGKTTTCDFVINGSGGVAADGVDCDSADVTINGSGSVGLAKPASLKAQINGSGNVKYHGEPTLRGVAVNGSGKLIKE